MSEVNKSIILTIF